MEHRIRVLLADDQSILADGIRSVLSSSGELEVVGIASDGFEALDLLEKCAPDVILMDIRMPNMNGVIATQEVKRRHPEVKVLILTTFDDSDYILNAINNGASGYLLKDTSAAALIDAIKNAYAGDTILPAKIARRIVDAARMVSSDREIKLKRRFGLSDREEKLLSAAKRYEAHIAYPALSLIEGKTVFLPAGFYEAARQQEAFAGLLHKNKIVLYGET